MKFCQFVLKIYLSRNKVLTSVEGHDSITNARKIMCNNPNPDVVDINAYTKFGEILSICSEDIERKGNYE